MDIVLELADTYGLDQFYSAIAPASPAPYDLLRDGAANATQQSLAAASTWQYHPASKYISFTPSDAAYGSSLLRDNLYRQGFSLFLLTW